MAVIRVGVCVTFAAAVGVAIAAQQPGAPAPAKPDTAEVSNMIGQLRSAAGPRWAQTVRFWCEEPRGNRPDDPVIQPTKITDGEHRLLSAICE
jgi:hypothetical protein